MTRSIWKKISRFEAPFLNSSIVFICLSVSVLAASAPPQEQGSPLTMDELVWTSCLMMSDQPGGAPYSGRMGLLKQNGFTEDLAKRYINFANKVLGECRDFESELPDKTPASMKLLRQHRDVTVRDRFASLSVKSDSKEAAIIHEFLDKYVRSKTRKGQPK